MWHVDQAGDDTVTVRRRISFITSLAYFYEVCPALLRITWFMLQKLPRRMVFGFLGFFDLWICAPDPATRRNACVCVFQILNFRVFVNEFCRTVFMQIRNFPRRILWLGFLPIMLNLPLVGAVGSEWGCKKKYEVAERSMRWLKEVWGGWKKYEVAKRSMRWLKEV